MTSTEAQRAVAARVKDLGEDDGFSELTLGHHRPATVGFSHGRNVVNIGDYDGRLVVGLGETTTPRVYPLVGTEITDADVEEAAVQIVEYLRSPQARLM